MTRKLISVLTLVAVLSVTAVPALGSGATVVSRAIWSGGELYGTVVTPADLPPHGAFDRIYSFAGSGLSGQRSISDAAPGSPGFNGGRWEVYGVTFTPQGMSVHDPDGDGAVNFELTSYAQLRHHEELGHLTIGTTVLRRFVCTLLPNY